MEYAAWNTLHDGGIESLGGKVPGDVEVRVGIQYLCEKLPTKAKHVVLRLRKCQRLEYAPFVGGTLTNLPDIAAARVEILSAAEVGDVVEVCCAAGTLRVVYEGVDILLAEGRVISQGELEDAARRYWAEWKEGARRGGDA